MSSGNNTDKPGRPEDPGKPDTTPGKPDDIPPGPPETPEAPRPREVG